MSHHQDLVKESLKYWLPNETILENSRPEWLQGLELDFYFPDRKIAIEVQGRQHRRWTPELQNKYSEFKSLLQRDKFKKRLCKLNGVKLYYLNHVFRSVEETAREKIFKKNLPRIQAGLRYKWRKYLSTWSKLEWRRKKQTRKIKSLLGNYFKTHQNEYVPYKRLKNEFTKQVLNSKDF